MSTVRKKNLKALAIVMSDLHLWHLPPLARAAEPDWFEAMRRPLAEVAKLSCDLDVPILCAGDVFHHWKASPELINFAIDALPIMYAIPGQHDLPMHDYGSVNKSAYATLWRAKIIRHLEPGKSRQVGERLFVTGFPWGFPVTPPQLNLGVNVCLHHAYRWATSTNSYVGAPKEHRVSAREYEGYDVAIIGDNHTSWDLRTAADTSVFNCGSLMRRNTDQVDHRPRVGVIMEDASVVSHYLDCARDVMTDTITDSFVQQAEDGNKLHTFVSELMNLHGATLDFGAAVNQAMDRASVSDGVRKLLLEAMGHGK